MSLQQRIPTMAFGAVMGYLAALIVPVFNEHHGDVDEGVLWGWAEAVERSSALLLVVAIAGAGALIAAVVLKPSLAVGTRLQVAMTGGAIFAAGSIPAVAIDGPETYDSVVLVPIVALVAAVVLLAGAVVSRTRRRLSIVLHAVGGVPLALAISVAATYDDNSSAPVRLDLALAIILSPLVVAALARRAQPWTVVATMLCAVHLAGLSAVVIAATSCDDDDCIPAPAWLIALTLAAVWSCAARLIAQPPVSPDEAGELDVTDELGGETDDEPDDSAARSTPAAHHFVMLAAPAIVALGGIGAGAMIDTDAEPTTFAAAPASLDDELPGMLGWTSDRVCERMDDPNNSSDTVVIVGSEVRDSSRIEVCFARFSNWMAPTPQAAITQYGDDASVSLTSGQVSTRTSTYYSTPIEPNVALRYETRNGGRHELWVDDTLIFEAVGGLDYSLRSRGLSDDGTWAFVTDSFNRLIVMPTDGSRPPVVLEDALDEQSEVEWGPGATFEPTTANLRDLGDSTYIPDGVDINATRELIYDQADALEDSVIVEFVVIEDSVWAQFINLPPLEATENGLCVWLSTWMNSDPSDRLLTQSIVGDGGASCRSEAESDGWRCGTVLTLPTVAKAEALVETDTLSMNATLFIPITVPGHEGRLTGLQRERHDYALGPVIASDLAQLELSDVQCGEQPIGEGRRSVPEPGARVEATLNDPPYNLDLTPGSQDIRSVIGRDQFVDAYSDDFFGYSRGGATCIADVLHNHARDSDLTREFVPAERLRIALDATACVANVAGPLPESPAPGDDSYGDELWIACANGFGLDCDALTTFDDRRYADFGLSCGGRTVITIGCALFLHGELAELDWTNGEPGGTYDLDLVPGPDTPAPGWTAVYEVLWGPCAQGDEEACRDLAEESPVGSMYEAFALTCGGRSTKPDCTRT